MMYIYIHNIEFYVVIGFLDVGAQPPYGSILFLVVNIVYIIQIKRKKK